MKSEKIILSIPDSVIKRMPSRILRALQEAVEWLDNNYSFKGYEDVSHCDIEKEAEQAVKELLNR